jgi:lysophospholipase
VIEGFRSMRELRNSPALKTMRVPTLMLIAEADGLVDPKAAAAIASRLPDVRVVRFGKESAHEVLREVDKVRNRAIGEIDLFLQARAPKQ